MSIILTRLAYNFDGNGETESITAEFSMSNAYPNTLNARLDLVKSGLAEGQNFDDLSRNQLEKVARKKLADITAFEG